jgi:predicted GIY-YIG superfamily endonuclease
MTGYVYLLHFERPIAPGRHTCQHYLGYAADLPTRIQAHATGHGARLTQVAKALGINWQLARLWHGDRTLERRLKNRKETPALCPYCRGHVTTVSYADEIPAGEIESHLMPF